MNKELSILVDRLNDRALLETEIIAWGCPVPSFGDLSLARVATIGLNPSNREFVDQEGKELDGVDRRFHTLSSLGIAKWSEANQQHLNLIWDLCQSYFSRNPYDSWFKRLDNIISGTAMSYYFPSGKACHLDLIPYATASKWTSLTSEQRSLLLEIAGDTLGLLIKNSPVELLVLNGQTVVDNLQKIADIEFERIQIPEWTLPRKSGDGVLGYAYKGNIQALGGVNLGRQICVLGYNHNIQSSFGVTNQVQTAIRNWISYSSKEIFS
jgi:hypothetical protein